jgi:hypothetical protein
MHMPSAEDQALRRQRMYAEGLRHDVMDVRSRARRIAKGYPEVSSPGQAGVEDAAKFNSLIAQAVAALDEAFAMVEEAL